MWKKSLLCLIGITATAHGALELTPEEHAIFARRGIPLVDATAFLSQRAAAAEVNPNPPAPVVPAQMATAAAACADVPAEVEEIADLKAKVASLSDTMAQQAAQIAELMAALRTTGVREEPFVPNPEDPVQLKISQYLLQPGMTKKDGEKILGYIRYPQHYFQTSSDCQELRLNSIRSFFYSQLDSFAEISKCVRPWMNADCIGKICIILKNMFAFNCHIPSMSHPICGDDLGRVIDLLNTEDQVFSFLHSPFEQHKAALKQQVDYFFRFYDQKMNADNIPEIFHALVHFSRHHRSYVTDPEKTTQIEGNIQQFIKSETAPSSKIPRIIWYFTPHSSDPKSLNELWKKAEEKAREFLSSEKGPKV